MKKVCIAVGHWNIEGITSQGLRKWRRVDALKKSTGASGERNYHWDKVMPLLRDKLIKAGIQVHITDAIYSNDIYKQDYDLLIALHYDGGGTENRCMISSPLRGVNPPYLYKEAHDKADEFCRIWKEIYPAMTGAINRDNRITAGMTEHYLWDYVKEGTPAVLIEHFNHTSAKGQELKNNPGLVAEADFQAIVKFLGIQVESPKPQQEPTMTISVVERDWLVSRATTAKEVAQYLEIDNPDHAPFDTYKKVIAGIKSTATAIQTQLTDTLEKLAEATQEIANRKEQVSRLENLVTEKQKYYLAQIDSLNKNFKNTPELMRVAEGRIAALEGQLDQAQKDKGKALNQVAILQASLDACQKANTQKLDTNTLIVELIKRVIPLVKKGL